MIGGPRFEGRDRAFVLLAGRLGLRPLETRMAPWAVFDGTAFTVSRARTKANAARTRTITVDAFTALDLKEWRLASGGRGDDPIIGHAATEDALRQWTRKRLKPVAHKITGRDDVTLYTLRHTHASALHYAGYTVPEAARRMCHSPVVHVSTYAHVIDAIGGERYADLDALITAARAPKSNPVFPAGSPAAP